MASIRVEKGRGDKLFGGETSAEALHIKMLNRGCMKCGRPATTTYKSFAPLNIVVANAAFAMRLSAQHDGMLPVVTTKYGKFVRTGMAYSCKMCEKECSREAAIHPSYCFVEIDRGPGADRVQA